MYACLYVCVCVCVCKEGEGGSGGGEEVTIMASTLVSWHIYSHRAPYRCFLNTFNFILFILLLCLTETNPHNHKLWFHCILPIQPTRCKIFKLGWDDKRQQFDTIFNTIRKATEDVCRLYIVGSKKMAPINKNGPLERKNGSRNRCRIA